jgi:ribosomal protein L37AE/L43A
MPKKELCPNCGSNKFHEEFIMNLYFCDNCQQEIILEEGQYYLSDIMGEPEGDALKPKGFVFR